MTAHCNRCRRTQPRDLLTAGRCRPNLDCAAHALIREARARGELAFARGVELGLERHGPWWEKADE